MIPFLNLEKYLIKYIKKKMNIINMTFKEL